MRTRYTLFILGLVFSYLTAGGQEYTWNHTWTAIEKEIANKNRWQDLEFRLSDLKKKAISDGDVIATARALNTINRLHDQKFEDTLFFYNSRYQDSLIMDGGADPLMKVIMLHLKAKRIAQFRAMYANRPKAALFRSYTRGEDYGSLSTNELDSLSDHYFQKALAAAGDVHVKDIQRLTWICADPYSLFFKPELSDLIYLERTTLKIRWINTVVKMPVDMGYLQWPSKKFLADTSLYKEAGYAYAKVFKDWIYTHPEGSDSRQFLEMQLKRVVYNQSGAESTVPYEAYLQEQIKSQASPVRASAVYQLCRIWTAGKDMEMYNYIAKVQDKRQYREAVELYQQHLAMLDSFPIIKKELSLLVDELTAPFYSIRFKARALPYRPMIADFSYRNVNRLFIRIVKLEGKALLLEKREIAALRKLQVVRDTMISVPEQGDHRHHSSFLRLSALPPGNYMLLFSDRDINTADEERVRTISLTTTHIAMAQMYGRMYILDNRTGFPLKGAKVEVDHDNDKKEWTASYVVNEKGWVPFDDQSAMSIGVFYGEDTVYNSLFQDYDRYNESVYDKDEYETRAEFYEDNLRMKIFTDRSIYRPGQEVFFKGILFTNDLWTGEQVVLNWGALKLPFYQKWLARAVQKFGNHKIELVITDAFNKPVDTIRVWPNKYGSFTGKYTIPKNAPTGEWDFDNDWFDIDYAGGSFKVEEYKKPTLLVEIDKPRKMMMLGDTVKFTVKTRSFAGADLDDVKVKVKVESNASGRNILLDTVMTSKKGKVEVEISDPESRDLKISTEFRQVYYSVDVEALDSEGETVELDENIVVSNRPVQVRANIGTFVDAARAPHFKLFASAPTGEALAKKIELRLYRIQEPEAKTVHDTWIFPKALIEESLGPIDTSGTKDDGKELVMSRIMASGEVDSTLLASLRSARYEMRLFCLGEDGFIGQATKRFTVYNTSERTYPQGGSFKYIEKNVLSAGEKLNLYTGNERDSVFVIYALGAVHKQSGKAKHMYRYEERVEDRGLQKYEAVMPSKTISPVQLHRVYVVDGQVKSEEEYVYVNEQITAAEVIVEQYRKQLRPGSSEKFSVRFKTKDYSKAAELMTVMYDASLDKLEAHRWDFPNDRGHWNLPSFRQYQTNTVMDGFQQQARMPEATVKPVWWSEFADPLAYQGIPGSGSILQGRAAGVTVLGDQSAALNEVVVTGYSARAQKNLTGSVVAIRGNSSMSALNTPMIIIDGVPFTGDFSKLDPSQVSDIVVLKGADATAIYGSRAADGVILISSSGKVQMPTAPSAPEQPAVIRKNFQETAFFYPRIYADRKGYYSFEFKVPENLTSWKWMMLAHTMKGRHAYAERSLTTQLPVMVQPAMPRFLYQGDELLLKSRISNLDTIGTEGTMRISIEDAVTGEDLTAKFTKAASAKISVQARSNTSGAFRLTVPEAQLNPVKIRVSYSTTGFSDGEENILPILSTKFLFTQTQKIELRKGNNEIATIARDTNKAAAGIGYFVEPQPRASMINALPGLVNYTWNCAEQTFNKILGYAVAGSLIRKDSIIARSWANARIGDEEELPIELHENIIPWARLNQQSNDQQKALYKLFDTAATADKLHELIAHLEDMQLNNGAMPWFKGGEADNYITAYLVKSMGKMREQEIRLANADYQKRLNNILGKMISYLDAVLTVKDKRISLYSIIEARGYHLSTYPADATLRNLADSLIQNKMRESNQGLASEAATITMLGHWYPKGSSMEKLAQEKLESLRQRAVADDVNGLRWKELADDEDLSLNHEETVALLAQAFNISPNADEVQKGVIKWLLQTRREHGWGSTKATAEVVTLLEKHGTVMEQPVQLKADGMELGNDLFSGSRSAYRAMATFPGTVTVQSNANTKAGINYYYISSVPPVSEQKDLTIQRELFYYDDSLRAWRLVEGGTSLKIGQKVKVELDIFTAKLLQYVTIQDRRAASFEVPGLVSGYENNGAFAYYQSVRDASMQFFASKIPPGRTRISYQMVVSKAGKFHQGHAVLSCMYNPDKTAYSKSFVVQVLE